MQNQMIAHIASTATERLGENMHEILKMAEQSVRGATRSAQECKNLAELAADLQKVVANFEIDEPSQRVNLHDRSDRQRYQARSVTIHSADLAASAKIAFRRSVIRITDRQAPPIRCWNAALRRTFP